jgi:hypothetical protein
MSPQRSALMYFVNRMKAAGYNAQIGDEVPALARCPKNGEILIELWLTDGQAEHLQNDTVASKFFDTIECYAFRESKPDDKTGLWYDDIQAVYDALTYNDQDRDKQEYILWDGKTSNIDRVAPLKNFDNGTSYSTGFKVVRIDLPIDYYRGLSL